MSTLRAFVTGATGFLGLNLVEQLAAEGWQVTAFRRPESEVALLQRFSVASATGDLLDADSLRRAMPEGVDAVFHVAADTNVWSRHNARQTRVNVEGTKNVLAAAHERGAKHFVHTSTWNVYEPGRQGALYESSPKLAAESWINYNRTKYLAEQAVLDAHRQSRLDAVKLNPAHIIG